MLKRKIKLAINSEDSVVEYSNPVHEETDFGEVIKFSDYSIKQNRENGSLEYLVTNMIHKAESSVVGSPDNSLYQASSRIAYGLTKDPSIGRVIALGIFYFLNNFSKQNCDDGPKMGALKQLEQKTEK